MEGEPRVLQADTHNAVRQENALLLRRCVFCSSKRSDNVLQHRQRILKGPGGSVPRHSLASSNIAFDQPRHLYICDPDLLSSNLSCLPEPETREIVIRVMSPTEPYASGEQEPKEPRTRRGRIPVTSGFCFCLGRVSGDLSPQAHTPARVRHSRSRESPYRWDEYWLPAEDCLFGL